MPCPAPNKSFNALPPHSAFAYCPRPTPQPQAPAAHKHKGKNGDSSDNLDSSDDEANASCDETLFHQKPPRQLQQPTEDEDDDSQSQDLLAEDAALLTSIAKRGQDEAQKEWNTEMELRAGNDMDEGNLPPSPQGMPRPLASANTNPSSKASNKAWLRTSAVTMENEIKQKRITAKRGAPLGAAGSPPPRASSRFKK